MSNTPNQWIPVSERLPDGIRYRVVRFEDGTFEIAKFNGVAWRNCDSDPRVGVTHWMDLPEPPAPPKPADPFEAWWDTTAFPASYSWCAQSAWRAAKAHYAKPLPDFETWWAGLYQNRGIHYLDKDGFAVAEPMAREIWNAAQGKPEA